MFGINSPLPDGWQRHTGDVGLDQQRVWRRVVVLFRAGKMQQEPFKTVC